jgi:hypothetical protein
VGLSQREAERVLEQKLKLSQKSFTDDALDQNLFKLLDVYEWSTFEGEATLSDTLFTSLTATLLYGIPLADVVPWQQLFRVELPTVEEYLRGVLIRIERVAPEEVVPALETVGGALSYIFVEPVAETIAPQVPGKAVYGVSRYDQSYFDPTAVREFLRSTAYAVTKRGTSFTGMRDEMGALTEALALRPEVAEDLLNRSLLVEALKWQGAVADYAWADETLVTDGRVRFRASTGEEVEVEVAHLLDAVAGCYADLSFADACYAMPEDYYRYYPLRYDPAVARVALDYLVSLFTRGFRDRLTLAALALANYQTAEERARVVTPRAETYALATSQCQRLDSLVEGFVQQAKPDATPVELNLYKVAVRALYGELFAAHRWGAEAQRAMARDQLKRYWVEKWGRYGLNPQLLDQLFDLVFPVVATLGNVRASARLKELQYRLFSR